MIALWRVVALLLVCVCGDGKEECAQNAVLVQVMPHRGLSFCMGCQDVAMEGSFVHTWEAYHNPQFTKLTAELVYALPNDAREELANAHEINGKIALVDRGETSFVEKVRRVQEARGIAIVVVDNGDCTIGFACNILGTPARNGLLEQDQWSLWSDITIPSMLILQEDGNRIKQAMNLIQVETADYGLQYCTQN